MIDEEKLFAWLDGELPPEKAAEVAAEVARNPELARMADEHRAMAAALRRSFDVVSDAPMPDRLASMESGSADVVRLDSRRGERAARAAPPLWKQMAALAATLALGIVAGNIVSGDPSSPIQPEAGRLVAAAELEEALYARLASAPAEEGPKIGLTFRGSDGNICRTFTDAGASGLACREGGDWRIRGLFQGPEGQASDYRMAAGPDPRLMELVDSTIDGEPFDAAQEQAAKERGWR